MAIKDILFALCFVFLNCCIFHDNCVRSYSGKIDFKSDPQNVYVVISKHSYSYAIWDNPDTTKISSKKNSYKLSQIHGNVNSVKVIYEIATKRLYFAASEFELHFDFCKTVLNYPR